MNRRGLGYQAEAIARSKLQQEGYLFIESNFTIRGGEIDLIMQCKDEVVFVEVKSLASEKYIKLEQSISVKKRRNLIRTAMIWLARNNYEDQDWRVDFIGIVVDTSGKIIRYVHYQNAIY